MKKVESNSKLVATIIMKRLLLLFALISIEQLCQAQKLEYSVHISSGLFFFDGNFSTNNSAMFVNYPPNYTNDPYGKKSGISYSFSTQLQKITKKNMIIGLQAGYESLTSKVLINYISGMHDIVYGKVTGQTYLNNHFINFFPYLGHRLFIKSINIDINAGTDISFITKSREEGKAMIDIYQFKSNMIREHPNIDFRLRSCLTGYYKHVGLSLGYSYGLTNYAPNITSPVPDIKFNYKAYARLYRFGISYRI
ncbi:MAG: hypothetical protein NTW49_04680 [Bacteroidia bacterium]|nr:hypothetical protein [Bacteroidia bacterium]